MNAHQRRKAIRTGTHYRCDNIMCRRVRAFPYFALTGCEMCWGWRMQKLRERELRCGKRATSEGIMRSHHESSGATHSTSE